MGQFYIIDDRRKLDYCIEALTDYLATKGWLMVTISAEKRSLTSNNLSHLWYGKIGEFMGANTMYARCYCKLMFGVAMARENPGTNMFFEQIGFDDWDYEKQLGSMKHIEVTRKFDAAQMKKYLADIQQHFAEEGLVLCSVK